MMEVIEVVPAKKRHAAALGRIMRPSCKAEAWAAMRALPAQAVRYSLNNSVKAWAVYAGGDLIAVGGVVLRPGGWAVPWVLTSVYVDRHKRSFLRVVKSAVTMLRERFPALTQMVHGDQADTLRLAQHLGFTVGRGVVWGKGRELFYPVTLVDTTRAVPGQRVIVTPGEAANAR